MFSHPSSLFVSHSSFAVLFFRGRELELWWRASQRATCSQSVQHSKRGSQETAWPGGFGLYTRHTLLRGDVHRCSTEGEPLPCLLSCSKVCCVASNTSNTSTGILILGMPWGAPWRVQTYSWKTHMPMTAPWALTSGTEINLRFQKKKKKASNHRCVSYIHGCKAGAVSLNLWRRRWIRQSLTHACTSVSKFAKMPFLCTVVSIVTMPTVTPRM